MAGLVLLLALAAGCGPATPASPAGAQPYLPTNYYDCILTTPNFLINNYFEHYSDVEQPSQKYDNKVFVFRDIAVTQAMLADKKADILWVGGIIKCKALTPGAVNVLRVGASVDVVGICWGVAQNEWALLMVGCVFLPAGAVNLPALGGATMTDYY